MMSDYLRLAMIMPFILQKFLNVSSLKNNEATVVKNRMNLNNISSVPKCITSCWVVVARTMEVAFSSKFTSDKYDLLQKCLDAELDFLPKVIIYKFIKYLYFSNIF